MKQKTAWLLLLAFITGISLSGCASMQEWCGPKKAVVAESQPEVKPAPQRQPEPPKPVPPPKKDRN